MTLTFMDFLLIFGLCAVCFILGWTVHANLKRDEQSSALWVYLHQLHQVQSKARAALAQWDDGDLSSARQSLIEIAQLGKDQQ